LAQQFLLQREAHVLQHDDRDGVQQDAGDDMQIAADRLIVYSSTARMVTRIPALVWCGS
jgi:hypothetical protein